jgi:hypothetical protein
MVGMYDAVFEFWFIWLPVAAWLAFVWRFGRASAISIAVLVFVVAVLSALKIYAKYFVVGPIRLE